MPVIKTRRGLDLPIHGAVSDPTVVERLDIQRVGLVPTESQGMKCRPLVEVGATVKIGTPLFVDRRDLEVLYTSPASGTVESIHRGERRVVQSIVIRRDGTNDALAFEVPRLEKASEAELRSALHKSGLWGALRQRPFDSVPRHDAEPGAILVTAMDSRPLAPNPLHVLNGREASFRAGLDALRRLTKGTTYLCVRSGEDWSSMTASGVEVVSFDGPHPSGTPGLHIHKLHPVGSTRSAWHVGYQDVADIGQFLTTGRVPSERVVALVGPQAKSPRLVRTRRGAAMGELLSGESTARELRAISGSVFEGRDSSPGSVFGFLGRYANQVTLLENETSRRLLSWALPLDGRFTQTNTLWDKFLRRRLVFDTDTNGSLRAFVPIGQYEKVMPLDILPTQLIKAVATGDIELAEKLGVLELAEEDLALCQFVDNSKQPITDMLREMLNRIEKEG